MILTHWSESKCKDIFQTLIVYKIPAKEHQVVDHWKTDEISVLEILFWKYLEDVPLILRIYEQLNMPKIARFKLFSFLSTQYFLGPAGQ